MVEMLAKHGTAVFFCRFVMFVKVPWDLSTSMVVMMCVQMHWNKPVKRALHWKT